MKNLLIGLTLVLLDISLFWSGHQIELLPDFVGFWFIAQNMKHLGRESRVFAKFADYAKGAAGVSLLVFVAKAVGVEIAWLDFVVDVAAAAMAYGCAWVVLQGIHEFEVNRSQDLQYDILMYGLRNTAIAAVVSCLLGLLPIVGIFGWIVEMIFAFGFLVDFKKTALLFSSKKERARISEYSEE
ncbi:MAG: hypothetical protein IKV41_06320 [Oscillospiraceae bacterium]|nr:hypothetical protein [Oscillospiraceae bacterium]